MGKIKAFFGRVGRIKYMKYIVVLVLGVLFVGFLDDNSLMAHLRNKQHINELSTEIENYTEGYNHDQSAIRELQHNPKAIEKIARERYFMKADDEDIFVLRDGEDTPTTNARDHETAE